MEKLKYDIWMNTERYTNIAGGIKLFRDNPNHYLEIYYGGNLDLYFNLNNLEYGTTFLIGKDDYQVYVLFDELYSKVLSGNCCGTMENDLEQIKIRELEASDIDYHDELKRIQESREECRQMNLDLARTSGLVDNGEIIWRSDDYKYKIFCSVRLRNSGSRYEPFNLCFMDLFNKLCALNPEYHQIHFEELLIDKELKKGESLERILKR